MNNLRAIVVFYEGQEIAGEHLKNIAEYTATILQLEEMPIVYTLNEKEIVQSVTTATKNNNSSLEDKTPAEHACIYIGTKFADSIKESTVAFASELSSHIAIAKLTHCDDRLLKAASVISDSSFTSVRRNVREKYCINKTIFDIISKIGKSVYV